MIIDTSVIVAIAKNEPEALIFADKLEDSESPLRISAASWLEAAIVLDSLNEPEASLRFDRLIDRIGIEISAVTAEQVVIARQAYRAYGKGSGHKAQLNFGDCFAYALAAHSGEPLLFKGNDFSHTDFAPA
jgi:ribonuclease VapC